MRDVLQGLLLSQSNPLPSSVQFRVLEFYQALLKANETQNLTRLTSPSDFYSGHLQDVRELLKTGWVEYPAMDLGSGAGIPGLLAALIEPGEWVLTESEKRKAAFLEQMVATLDLKRANRVSPVNSQVGNQADSHVTVHAGRAEEWFSQGGVHRSVKCIVVRAVGPISRIYSWIRRCSTWNNLILLKGPRWDVEWDEFRQTKVGKELILKDTYSYSVGLEEKHRKIIRLTRVPRGTL